MKDWRRERWRKLYLRESVQQRGLWPVVTRALRDYFVRIPEDDGTIVEVAADEAGAVQALLRAIGCEEDERPLVQRAVETLLADGYLAYEDGRIWVVNLPAAQGDPQPYELSDETPAAGSAPLAPRRVAPKSPAERQRARRQRLRDAREGTRHEPSRTTVTNRHELRHGEPVTPSRDASRGDSQEIASEELIDSQKNQPDAEETRAGARDSGRDGLRDEARDEDRDRARDVTVCDAGPKNRAEALALGECAAAAYLVAHPLAAAYLEPQTWPAVVAVSRALSDAARREPRRLGAYESDRGVRAVVTLLAAGHVPSKLVQVAKALPEREWWTRGGTQKGLSSLTLEVVDRELAQQREERGDGPGLTRGATDLLKAAGLNLKGAP